ncbi:MAG: phenylalanine--tRNA ligase subunit beta [Gemmatimonadota bacterium]|nr:phenylalanine--tRNA ligase subunit beta [Gemmatimonadota bacterium]
MNVSVNWLSDLLGTKLDADDVAHRLAMLGAPVDSIERLNDGLNDIVVARVESVAQHPDADRLSLCQVNTGEGIVEVVCGAPNVTAGCLYPYAPLETVLPGGLKLKKKKIRGIVSNGMLCSASELELGSDHDGIMELDVECEPGQKLTDVLPLSDTMLEVDVTPNRPDLLGHKGVARDLGAVLDLPVKLPPIPGAPVTTATPKQEKEEGAVGGVTVRLEDAEGCPRYMAAVIKGVKVGPSPDWLQARLRGAGQRPINNVVDATNYLLLELNQPMHAFDLAKLGGAVVVRRAKDGETLGTLDGEVRKLDSSMTAICDAKNATAIGGVMGGADSEVTDDTTDILLECAYFDPKRIRETRKTLKMSTDASYRYERGTDIQGMGDALSRAVQLIVAVAGGEESGAPVDLYPSPEKRRSVFLRPERVEHLLGVEVPVKEIEKILTRLGFSVGPKDERLAVHIPGWRPDVMREADLVEEIARIKGYDQFPVQMKSFRPSVVPNDPGPMAETAIRTLFVGKGLNEARSSSLVPQHGEASQALLNPLSQEEGYLRNDLATGLKRSVEYNWSQKVRDVRLFEIGTVFTAASDGGVPVEERRLAAVITGARRPVHFSDSGSVPDFDRWDIKSLFEQAVSASGLKAKVEAQGGGWIAVQGNGESVGWASELDADSPRWAAPLWGFEVKVLAQKRRKRKFSPLPSTPAAERDLALVLPQGVTASQVQELLEKRLGSLLENAFVFDEFSGEGLDGRSVAWRLVFRAPNRTLRDKDVDTLVAKVLRALEEQLDVRRREA